MSSFCGCVAKFKDCMGNNDQLIHSSGLRKFANPFTRTRNDYRQKVKEKKFSLKSEKKAPSTVPQSYSTPAVYESNIHGGGRVETFMLGQGFNHPELNFNRLWDFGCKLSQEAEIGKQSSRQDSLGNHKYKINFIYESEQQKKKDGKNSEGTTKSEKGSQEACLDQSHKILQNMQNKSDELLPKDFGIQNQDEFYLNEKNPQEEDLEYLAHLANEQNYFYEGKDDFNFKGEKLFDSRGIRNQKIQQIFSEEEIHIEQKQADDEENQEGSSQIPKIQIFTKQHENSDQQQNVIHQNPSFFDPNNTFDFRKDLSSYLDEMSLTQSIHDGESSNSVSEVIERSFYNILSECNQTPDHSTLAQTKPGCFVRMKLSQPTQKQSFS